MSLHEDAAVPPGPELSRSGIYRLLAVVLASMVPGLVAVDLFVGWRDSKQLSDEALFEVSDRLGWTNRAGFRNERASTDRFGLRNDEIPADAPRDEVRVLGVGASRLYGAGGALQHQLWSEKLEDELAAEGHENVRVLNGGVMGYSAVQAARRAIDLIPLVRPDLVFVLVSPGAQMLLDPSAARNWTRVGGKLVPRDLVESYPEWLHPAVALVHGLLTHSNIYRRHRARFTVGGERDASVQRWVISRAPRSPEVQEMLDRTFDELAALAAAAEEAGVELRVALLPEHYMATDASWEAFTRDAAQYGAPPVGTPKSEPVEVLVERLDELGIEVWSFAREAALMQHDAERYQMEDDYHWSEEGHELIADALLRELGPTGLLDELAARRAAHPRPAAAEPEE